MDYQEAVFNAAKDGDLGQLNELLVGISREDAFTLVSARTNGATPLIMACINGHLLVALYLIGIYNADIEQVGSITFNDDIIEEAFPLWCASAAGHLNVVQMLVIFNASVNSTTECNSTALCAACSWGQFEIVKFLIEHGADVDIAESDGLTCLMIACFDEHYEMSKYLLECGADINRKSKQGDTALNICAELGSLDILKMLLKNGAKSFCDSYGTTPLLTAALKGYSQIVDYFIHESSCTKQDQVNALELLGSFFMQGSSEVEKAFVSWKRAMKLRYEDSEYPLEKPVARSPISFCIDATEVRTLHELEELVSDSDEMSIQALLIVERIIGLDHLHTFTYIKITSDIYSTTGDFYRCKKLWMYVLDGEIKIRNKLNQRFVRMLSCLTDTFSFIMMEGSQLERVLIQDILHIFKICLILNEADICVPITEKNDNWIRDLHHILITAIRLVGLMCMLQPLNKEDDVKFKNDVYKLVHLNPKGMNGSTLLHLACSDSLNYHDNFCLIKFPSTEIVDILLDVGARPNAIDASNNTPLHVAAMKKSFVPAVFKALLNHGAHLDFCNNERKTPFQLIEGIPSLDVYPMHYINLKCLCAQAIRKYEILYVGFVHKRLKEFLDLH